MRKILTKVGMGEMYSKKIKSKYETLRANRYSVVKHRKPFVWDPEQSSCSTLTFDRVLEDLVRGTRQEEERGGIQTENDAVKSPLCDGY